MIKFTAELVAAKNVVDDVLTLLLSENLDGTGLRLEIQGGPYDEQDVSSGMDTYCICTETGACHYGGILGWELDEQEGLLSLRLDEEAARALDVSEGFFVRVPISYAITVRESMQKIIAMSKIK